MTVDLTKIFTYPCYDEFFLRKQKSLRRELLARENFSYVEKKIAILGGSTVDDIKNILEIFLLHAGIKPTFYQSEYNKFYEDAVFGNAELDNFQPDVIIIFTSFVNLNNLPDITDNADSVQEKLIAEYNRYLQIWESLTKKFSAVVIQNNFDLPFSAALGNFDAAATYGTIPFVEELNRLFANYAQSHGNFFIHDLHGLSARIGLEKWHNRFQYHAYKFAMNYEVMPKVALNLSKIIRAVFGKNKKCLVLDLDNTLWGGVIGDDGLENLQIGHETPAAEAFTEFQKYVLKLKRRGVILAVCSKNDEDVAKSGFTHPDSVLKFEDFAAFYANWQPKNENIAAIAAELNIGIDSLVFIDDNPAERQIVRDTLPEVAVPEVDAADIFSYIHAIEGAGYFEPLTISDDDLKRNDTYRENKQRQNLAASVSNYDDFLISLNMHAEIASFKPIYFDRIAQLTNKTNQFNLTTRRFTRAEIEQIAADSRYITLYGRLEDKFGDNGLISVIIGEKRNDEVHVNLWLMSCRVLKRGMEFAMLDELVKRCGDCKKIIGYYFPTKKNKMVENFYSDFGFTLIEKNSSGTTWELPIENYVPKNKFIKVGGEKI
ncbi:MAG: HAD family hydrolase [Selenomonadaceae bacterium]|nr:HAD family hydrolase [Selenomonadaceae bacterium]